MEYIQHQASNVYAYYYNLALKEFDEQTSKRLAQIPADYVYQSLLQTYPNCFINEECCLEYCLDRSELEFSRLDPYLKRQAYNKSKQVQSNVSDIEINNYLTKQRNEFKKNYFKVENERNKFDRLFKNLSVNPQNDLSRILKDVNL
jgi:hypothetical protein